MTPSVNTLLAFIIIALALVIVVLSFLVPDRKKANIALGLGIFVGAIGLIQLCAQWYARYQIRRNFNQLRDFQRTDLDQLRERLRERSGQTGPAGKAAPAPAPVQAPAEKKK